MREVNFRPADEIIDALRELHSYEEHHHDLTCKGCDWAGFEGEDPSWPCRTAVLVYSEEEILDVLEAVDLAEKWSLQRWYCTAPHRQRQPRNIWDTYAESFIADKVFPAIPVERSDVTYRFVKDA